MIDSIFLAFIKKESKHILRDRRTMILTLLMPIMLLVLFGFAISTEINVVRLTAVVYSHSPATDEILDNFNRNQYFDFKGISSPQEAETLLRAGLCDVAVYLKDTKGNITSQIMVDASNTTSARAMTAYTQGVLAGNHSVSPVITHTLFNPQMKSA